MPTFIVNTLYFGCRSAPKDQHYKAEWEKHKQDGALTYRIACSRDGPEGVKRTYIQDLMQEDAKRLWNLMNVEGAFVFISGFVSNYQTSLYVYLIILPAL